MNETKTACFIGHRKITITEIITTEITKLIRDLVAAGVVNFIFGSHSQFDNLCYEIVTKQQKQHPQIKRVHYCAAYENYTSAGINDLYEQEVDCETALTAGKNAYIVRNQAMIDNSDVCVFYYNKNYSPTPRKNSKRDLVAYRPRSGTAVAFQYAKNKHKHIINLWG